jgi:hypothetical protein
MVNVLMVIFGAGASFDSVDPRKSRYAEFNSGLRPPLANGLFQDGAAYNAALTAFPQCRALIADQLRLLPDGALLEDRLEQLQQEAETRPYLRRELAALRFYLQMMIWSVADQWYDANNGLTNYHSLLRRIELNRGNESVRLVTFNYDRILERAASDVLGISIQNISDHVSGSTYAILKPHGSVDWGRRVVGDIGSLGGGNHFDFKRALIDRTATVEIELSDSYVVMRGPEEMGGMTGQGPVRPYFPAITIPVQLKSQFEFPQEHRAVLDEAVAEARKIVVVGWRGAEKHFVNLWKGTRTDLDLLVVAGTESGSRETLNNLTPFAGGLVSQAGDGFSRFLDTDLLEKFLR